MSFSVRRMPIRQENPFVDPTEKLRKDVNPFVTELIEGSLSGNLPALFGAQLEGKAGQWKQLMAQKRGLEELLPLYVEIGCHKGRMLADMALDKPAASFLGIDITFKRVVETARKAKKLPVCNLWSLLANGRGLGQLFSKGEVDGFMVFFPDPWVKKKRQLKNRLLDASFLSCLVERLATGGFFWFKTDQLGYFEDVSNICSDLGLKKLLLSDLDCFEGRDYMTTFQKGFMDKGCKTYGCVWVKAQ